MRIFVTSFASSVSNRLFAALALLLVLPFAAHTAQAQSLGYEGPTGVFVTPLAYTSASPANGLGKPSVSYHFLAGGPVIGDFSTVSITEGFAKRFEAGYTSEIHAGPDPTGLWASDFSIVHAKATIVPENAGKTKWVPAIAVGGIFRFNDNDAFDGTSGQTTKNGDIYVVATKIVTQTKKVPVLLSAGLRGTNASLWGLGGNAPNWTARGFGALALVFTGPNKSTIIVGSEVSQQPKQIKAGAGSALDIPTSEVYAVRIVPLPKHKLNIDAGILHAGGNVGSPGVPLNLNARARVAFGISYGF
ncbi:MAG TPA: DUF3034 family protein [Terracidiphilus sp.]|nr:DUF3034 family protein [Terracidiphilus sp.]